MEFVVKLTGPGYVTWLGASQWDGYRTFSNRESADVFQTREDANSAAFKMPPAFKSIGLVFSVEPATKSPLAASW